ncbi:MAG: hypothetical protein LBD23_04705 [Oscillospiraceae bacterium]|jgi:hypothetical protein|nr:hypothetical protein [Oscillospiraceae bacterium]
MAKTDTSNTVKEQNEPVTTYHEKKIGKTLYKVTSVYKGEVDFTKAMEDLIIRKILRGDGAVESPQSL